MTFEYYTESDGPIMQHKKKRNRERQYTWEFIKQMRRDGARADRYPDDSKKHFKYDGYVFYYEFMPFEAKFLESRKTFNVETWKNNQLHQYLALMADYRIGAKPFLLILHKTYKIERLIMPIWKLPDCKVPLSGMYPVDELNGLVEVLKGETG